MTKQEILEYFKDINQAYNESTRLDDLSHMLDELMQGNSDEDCISRQAAISLFREHGEVCAADIKELPSVTPVQKMGRWIDDRCSVCGKGIEDLIDSHEWYRNEQPNFCPFCGVKMQEVENDQGRSKFLSNKHG